MIYLAVKVKFLFPNLTSLTLRNRGASLSLPSHLSSLQRELEENDKGSILPSNTATTSSNRVLVGFSVEPRSALETRRGDGWLNSIGDEGERLVHASATPYYVLNNDPLLLAAFKEGASWTSVDLKGTDRGRSSAGSPSLQCEAIDPPKVSYSIDDEKLQTIAQQSFSLNELDLTYAYSIRSVNWSPFCGQLRVINLSIGHFRDHEVCTIVSHCPKLLKITLPSIISDLSLTAVAEGWRDLISLTAKSCDATFTDAGGAALAHRCSKLGVLSLYSRQLTGASLRALSEGCEQLSYLEFGGWGAEAADVATLFERCRKLTRIDLGREIKVTDPVLQILAQRCDQLERIHFSGDRISEVGWQAVADRYRGITLGLSASLDKLEELRQSYPHPSLRFPVETRSDAQGRAAQCGVAEGFQLRRGVELSRLAHLTSSCGKAADDRVRCSSLRRVP